MWIDTQKCIARYMVVGYMIFMGPYEVADDQIPKFSSLSDINSQFSYSP